MVRSIAINVTGGTGKNASLTHILPELKEKYEHIYIRTPYKDIFECCPEVDYVYGPDEVRAFFMDNKGIPIIHDSMYTTDAFIKKTVSYADAWRIMLGLDTHNNKDGSDVKTIIDPSKKFPQLRQMADELDTGPFIIVQFWGGQTPLVQVPLNEKHEPDWGRVPYDYEHEPLKRHYPVDKAQEFVNLFRAAHPDVRIIQYSLPNEPRLVGCEYKLKPYLAYNLLARSPNCQGIVAIDSSLQHLTAGLCKAVILWAHSLPTSFGYEYNHNIIQKCNRDDILYFTELGPSAARVEYIEPDKLLDEVEGYLYGDDTNTVCEEVSGDEG